jgi:hypothetical protein
MFRITIRLIAAGKDVQDEILVHLFSGRNGIKSGHCFPKYQVSYYSSCLVIVPLLKNVFFFFDRKGVLLGFGHPLLDITVTVTSDFLAK